MAAPLSEFLAALDERWNATACQRQLSAVAAVAAAPASRWFVQRLSSNLRHPS